MEYEAIYELVMHSLPSHGAHGVPAVLTLTHQNGVVKVKFKPHESLSCPAYLIRQWGGMYGRVVTYDIRESLLRQRSLNVRRHLSNPPMTHLYPRLLTIKD